ncbi:MAG: NIPSNAP family protein [Chloroflexi bacterium]|nr:NIPSNAP family protein [Chloroflexota bacterium]
MAKVYHTVRVVTDNPQEFNEFWARESLPLWIKHGAKHIGSFSNWIGGPTDEIFRIFEFESLEKFEAFEKFLAESPQGKDLIKRLGKYIKTGEKRLIRSIYNGNNSEY